MNATIPQLREMMAFAQKRGESFLRWWLAELRDMVPSGIARKLGIGGTYTLVQLGRDTVTVRHWDAAGSLTARTANLEQQRNNIVAALPAGKPVFVSIDIENALTGTMTVPIAAEMRLNQAVAFEIERLCPFRIGDALFDYMVTERDRKAKTLAIEWAVVPRVLVQKSYDAVSKLGLKPSAVGVAGDQPRSPRYTFARYSQAKPLRIGKPAAVLAAACFFFAVAAAYTGYASETKRQQILAQIETSKAKAEQAKALRTQTEVVVAAVTRLTDRARAPKSAAILAELSTLLPDDTWVQKFSVNGGEVRLIGVSATAAALIERLAASPLLHNPRFQAPITVASGGKDKKRLENFDIAATIKMQAVPGGKE